MKKGFTLIELLVVIAIIAILAIVGVTIFGGIPQRAKDAQRKSDIKAIVSAYEQHFDNGTSKYPVLLDSWFASGKVPTPPEGGSYSGLLTAPSSTGFKVCATLDDASQYCQESSQIKFQ